MFASLIKLFTILSIESNSSRVLSIFFFINFSIDSSFVEWISSSWTIFRVEFRTREKKLDRIRVSSLLIESSSSLTLY